MGHRANTTVWAEWEFDCFSSRFGEHGQRSGSTCTITLMIVTINRQRVRAPWRATGTTGFPSSRRPLGGYVDTSTFHVCDLAWLSAHVLYVCFFFFRQINSSRSTKARQLVILVPWLSLQRGPAPRTPREQCGTPAPRAG